MTRRYIAQRALTGEVMDYEVPIVSDGGDLALSAVGQFSGTCSPDIGALRHEDGRLVLEEWGTYLYEEEDGDIKWGGIVISSGFQGPAWTIEAAGFATYAHGTPFDDHITSTGIEPVELIRRIWANVQRFPDSALGLTIVGDTTNRLIGTPEEPYELAWYDTPDAGSEVDKIVTEAGIEWTERHRWDGDTIRHELVVGYPRLGRTLDALSFVQGQNIVEPVTVSLDGDEYASAIVGVGAGEGAGAIRRNTSTTTGRLRRTRVVTDKTVTTTARMDAIIATELARLQVEGTIDEVVVVNHPNAPFGAFGLGDDIVVDAKMSWLGSVSITSRIVKMTPQARGRLALGLVRSDSFTYGN